MAVSRILSADHSTVMIISLSDTPETHPKFFGPWRTGCPVSVLSCTAWGFSCLANHSASGELLPRLFTLVPPLRRDGLFSVTLSVSNRFREYCPRLLRGMPPYGVRTFLPAPVLPTSGKLYFVASKTGAGRSSAINAHNNRPAVLINRSRLLFRSRCD
jgi:hypothetical protein